MFMLYGRGTSLGEVGRALGVPYIYYPTRDNRVRESYRDADGRLVRLRKHMSMAVNIGISGEVFDPTIVLNPNIRIAISKTKSFAAFREHGVAHPQSYQSIEEAFIHHRYVLGRRDRLHSGRGITLFDREQYDALPAIDVDNAAAGCDFFVEQLTCREEARVHVFGDDIIAVQIKRIPEGCGPIHTHETGCTFHQRHKLKKWFGEEGERLAYEQAWRACRAVGNDFGAVDVLLTDEGAVRILEVNSAPGVRTDSLAERYAAAFSRYIID